MQYSVCEAWGRNPVRYGDFHQKWPTPKQKKIILWKALNFQLVKITKTTSYVSEKEEEKSQFHPTAQRFSFFQISECFERSPKHHPKLRQKNAPNFFNFSLPGTWYHMVVFCKKKCFLSGSLYICSFTKGVKFSTNSHLTRDYPKNEKNWAVFGGKRHIKLFFGVIRANGVGKFLRKRSYVIFL